MRWFLGLLLLVGAIAGLIWWSNADPYRINRVAGGGSNEPITVSPQRPAEPVEPEPMRAAPARRAAARARPEPTPRPAPSAPRVRQAASLKGLIIPDASLDQLPEVEPELPEPETLGVQWAVDADGIKGAVEAARPRIARCYAGWLASGAKLEGKLQVKFTITADEDPEAPARITAAHLQDSELDHALMEGCVLNTMTGLKFDPPSDGPMTVTYPLNFSSVAPPVRLPR